MTTDPIAAAPDLSDMVATLADALEAERAKVAAAYEEAAVESPCCPDCRDAIRALTPADAQAALDGMLAEARLEGWRAGRDAAAQWLIEAGIAGDHDSDPLASSIRDLPEPKEASHV